ncbi:MAG: FAD binding domain-containing protein [Clostridiaceae bacterium]
MFTLVEFFQPETLKEAYEKLTVRKTNTILGGCAYLKMGNKKIGTGIDLSKLNLDYINNSEDYIEIGASTTFREIETSELLNTAFNGVLNESVKDIIGVQFRNIVTAGASVYSKYGFSDFITALLSLDTEVELYKSGKLPLGEFLVKPYEKDILTKIYIKKNRRKAVYKSLRNSKSDYAILCAAVSKLDNDFRIVVGARPACASVASEASKLLSSESFSEELLDKALEKMASELVFGTNMRASGEYRQSISKVLVKRAVMEVLQCK